VCYYFGVMGHFRIKILIQILGLLIIVSCQTNSKVFESDKKLVGKYKQTSGAHYEIIILGNDYLLTSTFSSRGYQWQVFNEYGSWKTIGDTLLIRRIRNDTLKKDGYPENQTFLIKDKNLFELEYNYKGELFETTYYFEKQ